MVKKITISHNLEETKLTWLNKQYFTFLLKRTTMYPSGHMKSNAVDQFTSWKELLNSDGQQFQQYQQN